MIYEWPGLHLGRQLALFIDTFNNSKTRQFIKQKSYVPLVVLSHGNRIQGQA